MGHRVRAVMHELNEEKIDIIDYSPIRPRSLPGFSPAKVTSVIVVDESLRAARVVVPDISCRSPLVARAKMATRSAAQGWRIDIRSDTAPS